MSPLFLLLAGLTLGGAVAAMVLRNPVHCALCLVVTFTGLAGVYLDLGAHFLGLAQVLVYVGAVAILLVFVLLLTRSGEGRSEALRDAWKVAVPVALAVMAALLAALWKQPGLSVREQPPALIVPVKDIGQALMGDYVLPLQLVGVVLTVAMIGAAIIALQEKRVEPPSADVERSRR